MKQGDRVVARQPVADGAVARKNDWGARRDAVRHGTGEVVGVEDEGVAARGDVVTGEDVRCVAVGYGDDRWVEDTGTGVEDFDELVPCLVGGVAQHFGDHRESPPAALYGEAFHVVGGQGVERTCRQGPDQEEAVVRQDKATLKDEDFTGFQGFRPAQGDYLLVVRETVGVQVVEQVERDIVSRGSPHGREHTGNLEGGLGVDHPRGDDGVGPDIRIRIVTHKPSRGASGF